MEFRRALNFRELGGYLCDDSRHVKYGVFYRSGALADMNEQERSLFAKLGIRHIFDFRSDYEAKNSPDPVFSGINIHQKNAMIDRQGNSLDFSPAGIAKMQKETESLYQTKDFLEIMYYNLPFSSAYQDMFAVIQKQETPILFHCSAGKDRTGIAAALILLTLGVSRETVMEDYMLTNEYRAAIIERFMARMRETISDEEELAKLLAYEGVLQKNAEVSLRAIDDVCGSFETYLVKQFGIDAQERARLRELYTE